FYFMMRKGGCCGGHSHGKDGQHSGHSLENSNTGRAKDPVCGMEIEVNDAATIKLQHMGQTFYLCSSECKEKFDKNPTLYKEPSQKHGGCC
ncbi:MAG: YHS domain-containing protein, partial [Candidatus Mariimomonas ferrooxydans]